ncbi:MAG: hypothetical protein NC517_10570 [Firmicutes bacterium]|nr:hypothetical protein [Bacillota bacterium]
MLVETNEKGKIDSEFEYGWYMESIELHCDGMEDKAREVLWGMFRGVLRYVTGYRWLDECPTGIDLKGVNVTAVAQQNEAGKNRHDILGNWDIVFTFTPCEDSKAKVTTKNTLISIQKSMERFIRTRYDLKEPEDLSLILLEQQRKELIEKHFTGTA